MAHYALINEDNIVVKVITGVDETNTDDLPEGFSSWEDFYSDLKGLTCKRTSYNTNKNTHNLGGTPYRGNYAWTNYEYNEEHDIFIPPKQYPSWVLDLDTASYVAPTDYPDDGNHYNWNEETLSWDLHTE